MKPAAAPDLAWQLRADHVRLHVRLTPKADRDALGALRTLSDGQCVLEARVRAIPEDGKANAALTQLIAKALGLPKSAVSLDQGAKGRTKTLILTGDPAAIARSLAALNAPRT
jgi:uncharacterized protein YggU (UPF0235/DUF167 family)